MSLPDRMLLGLTFIFSITGPIGVAQARHAPTGRPQHGRECGSAPDDHDQVAAVRAQAAAECDCASATHHGGYVSCVAHVAKQAIRNGTLARQCRRDVVSCAAQSTCGKPGFVTCCRTNSDGVPRCAITKSNGCRAPEGGTATVGQTGSCCDGCGGGATTTTLPSGCGNGHIHPGEQCDPPGSHTCPSGSPGGAMLDCQPGCVCPGGPTTTTRPAATTTTVPTGSTTTTAVPRPA